MINVKKHAPQIAMLSWPIWGTVLFFVAIWQLDPKMQDNFWTNNAPTLLWLSYFIGIVPIISSDKTIMKKIGLVICYFLILIPSLALIAWYSSCIVDGHGWLGCF